MIRFPVPLLVNLAALLTTTAAFALELKPLQDGMAIEAGSLGRFTLAYPVLRDVASQPVHQIVEIRIDGKTATLRYDGGGSAAVTAAADGEIAIAFSGVPSDVKSFELGMLIDIAFSQGGKWKIGDASGEFPRSKPDKPHLYQANATALALTNARGAILHVTAPDYSFQQLTDNRAWNWPTFHWMALVPFNADNPHAKVVVRTEQSTAPAAKLVDPFGQSKREEWPGKLKSGEELKADVKSDESYYAALKPPVLDRFGGAPGSGEKLGLKATGFFHIEKKGDKSWLVDPEGNAFFHFGICGFAPGDDYTYVKGREDIYEWLPKFDSEFRSAFRPENGSDNFSFYLANVIRKFGEPYSLDSHAARMISRVRAWGFNSIGAFSPTPPTAHKTASFPYVAHLPINEWEGVKRIPGAWEVWDPFDDETAKRIAGQIANQVPVRADDPLLIGWFIVNEPRYDELPKVIPALPGKHACKRRFVQSLEDKYKEIAAFNTAWQARASNFDELADQGLEVKTDEARSDVKAFVGLFLDTLLANVTSACRKADPNHLVLGCRLQPVTIEDDQLCRISGRYLDVMSYNYYTYGIDADALGRYHEWTGGLPLMLSEFFWSSPSDSGLTGGREVKSQTERGLAYRNYVEQSAALGFVVGIEWFTLVDQATTGRWFSQYTGESANTGLISVADRPWKAMIEEMTKTNHTIYPLLLGEREPFKWEDARFNK